MPSPSSPRAPDVQVGARGLVGEGAVLVPVTFAQDEREALCLERCAVRGLVGRVGDRQVEVDDRLGREPGHSRRSHVLQVEHLVTECASDALSDFRIGGRP